MEKKYLFDLKKEKRKKEERNYEKKKATKHKL